MTPEYITISDHSPSIGLAQMEIRNPDSRESLQVETDERRWHDNQLHRRVDSLIVEVGRVSDFIFLIAEKQDQLARDIAEERSARMKVDEYLRQRMQEQLSGVIETFSVSMTEASTRVNELESIIVTLLERTWWSMFKDLFRRSA